MHGTAPVLEEANEELVVHEQNLVDRALTAHTQRRLESFLCLREAVKEPLGSHQLQQQLRVAKQAAEAATAERILAQEGVDPALLVGREAVPEGGLLVKDGLLLVELELFG